MSVLEYFDPALKYINWLKKSRRGWPFANSSGTFSNFTDMLRSSSKTIPVVSNLSGMGGSAMEKTFQREVDALQAPQQLHRQHGDTDGADRQRDAQEDQAVGDGRGKQDDQGQQAQDGACDLKEEHGAVNQQGAEPDGQGEQQRDRRGEDFQDGFHVRGLLSVLLLSLYRLWDISQGYGKSGATVHDCRPVVHRTAASLERMTLAASSSLSYSARRLSRSAS